MKFSLIQNSVYGSIGLIQRSGEVGCIYVPGFKRSRIKNKGHYDENKTYAWNLNEMEMFF